MKKSILFTSNNALAGVIEALLLVGLVAIILSFIQLYYIPEIMEDKEATHMDQVSQQFSQLKSVVEIQSTIGVINDENPDQKYIAYTTMASPLTLGSRQLPYFVSLASPGQVTLIDNNDAGEYKIKINPSPLPMGYDFPSGIPLTSIIYEAYNYYFVPQKYIFEGGGVILYQTDGEVMSVNPAINVVNNTDDIELTYNIPLFVGSPGKKIDAGYDESDIRTNYIKYYEGSENNISEIFIYTQHPDAWYHCLVNTTRGLLWEYVKNNYVNVIMDKSTTPNYVKITPGSKDIYVKITVVEIGVQIGPGAVVSK
jgi:hypothetical protein